MCTIDIVLKDDVVFAASTFSELYLAADELQNACVARDKIGGIAMDLGANHHLHS